MDSAIYKSISDQLRQDQADILRRIAALNGELKGLDRAIAVVDDIAGEPNRGATPAPEEEVIDFGDITTPEAPPTSEPRPTRMPRDGSMGRQIARDIRKMILAHGKPMTGPEITEEVLKNPPPWTAGWAVITDGRIGQTMARQHNFLNLPGRGYWPKDVVPPAGAGAPPYGGMTTEEWQQAVARGRSQTANEFYATMREIILTNGKPLTSNTLHKAVEEMKPRPAWVNGWNKYDAGTIAARLSNSRHLFVNIKGHGYWPTDRPVPAESADEDEPVAAESAEEDGQPVAAEPQETVEESERKASQWSAAAFYADVRKLLLEAGRPITSGAMAAIFSQMEPRVWSEKWTATDGHAYSSRLSRRTDKFVNIAGHGYWIKDTACPLVGYEPEEQS